MKSHFILITEDAAYGFPFSSVLYYKKVIQDAYFGGSKVEIYFANGAQVDVSLQYGMVFISEYLAWLENLTN